MHQGYFWHIRNFGGKTGRTFLSLFGEQITKQYLSESVTNLDYFIFAMAPMGILTVVVSAIPVWGTPWLHAFIGRAQEGSRNAEAELCTSTSRDVCELYNSGGIARVFGRPKILEVPRLSTTLIMCSVIATTPPVFTQNSLNKIRPLQRAPGYLKPNLS
jgi:hypothetical protein